MWGYVFDKYSAEVCLGYQFTQICFFGHTHVPLAFEKYGTVVGGRYDEVGAVFGRNRPAAGFSLDIKSLVAVLAARPLRAAIRAPWRDLPDLRAAVAALRAQGQTVVCVLPGHEAQVEEFHCDRELIQVAGQWVVQAV
jgi:ATP phosphoribosyltransferase regulatory subunit